MFVTKDHYEDVARSCLRLRATAEKMQVQTPKPDVIAAWKQRKREHSEQELAVRALQSTLRTQAVPDHAEKVRDLLLFDRDSEITPAVLTEEGKKTLVALRRAQETAARLWDHAIRRIKELLARKDK